MIAETQSIDASIESKPAKSVRIVRGSGKILSQAFVMTMLLNPTTLRRVYDNELAVSSDTDVLTLPELLDAVSTAAWEEIGFNASKGGQVKEASFAKSKAFSVRHPAISSLRRNLQREHLQRLIDLSLQKGSSSSTRSIALLARMTLEGLGKSIDACLEDDLDAYTRAHLTDSRARITKALDASYTYGAPPAVGAGSVIFFGKPGASEPR